MGILQKLDADSQNLVQYIHCHFADNRQIGIKVRGGGRERCLQVRDALAATLAVDPVCVLGQRVFAAMEVSPERKERTALLARTAGRLRTLTNESIDINWKEAKAFMKNSDGMTWMARLDKKMSMLHWNMDKLKEYTQDAEKWLKSEDEDDNL